MTARKDVSGGGVVVCEGCKQSLDACPYGGDCLEVQAIYRAEQREKLRDIDPDEIECDWCRRSYTDCCFDPCYGRADAALSEQQS